MACDKLITDIHNPIPKELTVAKEKKDNPLDSFAKTLGRKLGQRRKDVHQSIARFHAEANKEEATTPAADPPIPDEEASRPAPDNG